MSDEKIQTQKPPYLSFTTLKNFIGGFKEGVVPSRIDKSLMVGQSGATQSYLLGALKFFSLINEAGTPQGDLNALVEADADGKKVIWRRLVETAYAQALDGLDLSRSTAGQLQEKFAALQLNGETLRKAVSFFVAAADESGMAMSPQLKPNTRGLSGGGRKRKPKTQGKPAESAGDTTDSNHAAASNRGGTSASLLLNIEGTRKISLHGPPSITPAELERLKTWVAVQFIVE